MFKKLCYFEHVARGIICFFTNEKNEKKASVVSKYVLQLRMYQSY